MTELHTVRQQLTLVRKRRQMNASYSTHCPEPYTLKLNAQQKQRLEQQLQQVQEMQCTLKKDEKNLLVNVHQHVPLCFCCPQHVQLLTQVQLLTSPVLRLHSEAETTRQFLVTLTLTCFT